MLSRKYQGQGVRSIIRDIIRVYCLETHAREGQLFLSELIYALRPSHTYRYAIISSWVIGRGRGAVRHLRSARYSVGLPLWCLNDQLVQRRSRLSFHSEQMRLRSRHI